MGSLKLNQFNEDGITAGSLESHQDVSKTTAPQSRSKRSRNEHADLSSKKAIKLSSQRSTDAPSRIADDGAEFPMQTPVKKHRVSTHAKLEDKLVNAESTDDTQQSLQRKKSVTFTPETKTVDGFSAHKLFQNWKAEQRDDKAEVAATPTVEPTSSATSQADRKADKKEKKRKARQMKQESLMDASHPKDPSNLPYVQYLQTFHQDRSQWKFNKKNQSDLLKNLFNLYRIPARYNDGILDYVVGLQGAASQHRLLDEAEAILQELLAKQDKSADIQGMATRRARKAVYDRALEDEYVQEQPREVEEERHRRAEAVLSTLLDRELPTPTAKPVQQVVKSSLGVEAAAVPAPKHLRFDEGSPEPTVKPQTEDVKRKRSRKSRTEVSSSSSDDDSSDSSSDSSGDESDTDS